MSEIQSEATPGLLPEFTADVATTDNDKALMAIWEKNNSPAAELKNPAMPATFAAAEGDHFTAVKEWTQLSMKDRRETAAVHREFADLKKQGEALGMKTETAADIKAVQDMLAGKAEKQEAPPAIDKDTQATFDTVHSIFPDAKDHREAASSLKGLVEHVARDPVEGTLAVLKSLPLTPHQRHQVYERMFGEAMQQPAQPEEPDVAPYLDAWAKQSGATKQDMAEMAEIMTDPTWREIQGESDKSALDRAYKALQRSRGRQTSTGRQNRELDAELRGLAADIYRA
jgi:hypothetical protein